MFGNTVDAAPADRARPLRAPAISAFFACCAFCALEDRLAGARYQGRMLMLLSDSWAYDVVLGLQKGKGIWSLLD